MAGHAYHPMCGCSQCDAQESDDERREEYIAEFAAPVAKQLIADEDFAADTLVDLSPAAKDSILRDVGSFFTRFQNSPDDPETLAAIGCWLWRELRPTIEETAKEQAATETATEYDRKVAA